MSNRSGSSSNGSISNCASSSGSGKHQYRKSFGSRDSWDGTNNLKSKSVSFSRVVTMIPSDSTSLSSNSSVLSSSSGDYSDKENRAFKSSLKSENRKKLLNSFKASPTDANPTEPERTCFGIDCNVQ